MRIKIKYLDEACRIEKIEKGDWIDLRSRIDLHMERGDFHIIPLGVCMELPKGFEGHLCPRSSTFKRWGLLQANSMGIFDNSFCGDGDEWGFPCYATRPVDIKKGDRLCQFRIIENQPPILFEEVETLGNPDRGGWGSTGGN